MIINGEKSIIMDNESFRRATFQKKLLDSMTKKYLRFCYEMKIKIPEVLSMSRLTIQNVSFCPDSNLQTFAYNIIAMLNLLRHPWISQVCLWHRMVWNFWKCRQRGKLITDHHVTIQIDDETKTSRYLNRKVTTTSLV